MKIKVIKTAFYDGSIVNENDVINYKGDVVPKWATLVNGKQSTKKQTQQEPKADDETVKGTLFGEEIKTEDIKTTPQEDEPKADNVEVVEDPDVNNADKLAELEALLDKTVELNCSVDIDNKTIQEQIDVLKKAIEEKESKK